MGNELIESDEFDEQQFGLTQYTFYCSKCCRNHKAILKFSEWQNGLFNCPECNSKLKFVTSNDIRSPVGNLNYKSAEKQSEENIKRLGKEGMNKMVAADPIASHKKESSKSEHIPWWRKGLKDPSKPLDLNTIADKEDYIMTGKTK